MVGRKKRRGKKQNQLGNHQRSWIWGRHAVMEMLRARKWTPLEILICEELLDENLCTEFHALTKGESFSYQLVTGDKIERQVRARDHQGLAARMTEFPVTDLESLLKELPEHPFLLIIDRIQDPYNFGAILRTADLMNVHGVIIGTREQVGITSHVARSSVGAVNYLPVATVDSLTDCFQTLQDHQFNLVAASEKGNIAPAQIDFTQATALIIGNEGVGVSEELLQRCNQLCAIPQGGHIDSLNAAVAAGILCYEVQRQRLA